MKTRERLFGSLLIAALSLCGTATATSCTGSDGDDVKSPTPTDTGGVPGTDDGPGENDAPGSGNVPGGQSPQPPGQPAAGGFGAPCTQVTDTGSTECQSGVCSSTFEQLGNRCSLRCTDAAECPQGSQGQKCNKKGYCRP
jgi:hypothetical protein